MCCFQFLNYKGFKPLPVTGPNSYPSSKPHAKPLFLWILFLLIPFLWALCNTCPLPLSSVTYYSFVRISRSFLCISHVLLVSLQLDCILPEGKNHILISSLYFRGPSTSGKNIGVFCCMILISCIAPFILIRPPEHSPSGSFKIIRNRGMFVWWDTSLLFLVYSSMWV